MSWYEHGLKNWYSRMAHKRKELSDSVEETLKDTAVRNEDWDDEDDFDVPQHNNTSLIPPRLSLQSKPLPAVHPPQQIETQVHSSPVSTIGARAGNHSTAVSPSTEPAPAVSPTQRLAGRSTKVHLQVVSKPESIPLPAEARVQSQETGPYSTLLAANLPGTLHSDQPILSGTGKFEDGQSDAAVLNTHITACSVVLVTLTSDPGPVVVQYISLQPELGFTIHLTAPTKNCTLFNYAILNSCLIAESSVSRSV
jgi:hypothetical protein